MRKQKGKSEPITFLVIVHLVLGLSGVERSPECFPLQCGLTLLLYVLHMEHDNASVDGRGHRLG